MSVDLESRTAVTCSRRECDWVLGNLDFLAPWHSTWWLDWGEEWSNDPQGDDPRSNSYALWRTYCEADAVFFTAELGERTIGMAVGLWLGDNYYPYWASESQAWTRQPAPGDFELALVFVEPEFRGNGVLRKLSQARIDEAARAQNARGTTRCWVQCLDDPNDKSHCYYTAGGFEKVAVISEKATRRAILCADVPTVQL